MRGVRFIGNATGSNRTAGGGGFTHSRRWRSFPVNPGSSPQATTGLDH